VGADGSPYYNTQLLPFQTARLGFSKLRMGGCAGCHDAAAGFGNGFSFALGNNVTQPEHTNALGTPNRLRSYFPPR
jgi:cytochrome c peroxidase